MGYFWETVKGVSWVTMFRISTRLISLARTIILARFILTPVDFGLYGIATLVLAFLEILTETGINVFLIQKKEDINKYVNTAWIVSILRGLIISFAIILFSHPISLFFSSPGSYNLLFFIALVPLIRGFINPSIVKFQKNLEFKKEFWFKFTVFTFDSISALLFAYLLQSSLGLVIGLVAGSVLELILSFVYASPRPQMKVNATYLKEILSQGKWITGAGVFQYLFKQGDDIVVGRILGEGPLGFYQVAYKISTLPVSEITDVFNKVVFPVYVKISDDKKRLKKAFLKITAIIALSSSLLGIFVFSFAPQIVNLVLGDKWLEVIPVMQVLAIFGITQAISNSGYSLLLALEKNKIVVRLTLVGFLVLIVSIVPFVQTYGIVGAGLSALLGSIVTLPIMCLALYNCFKS